ncbi:MAG: glycosyltransferase family 2 protein [Anaerolineae bacterium]|nr:glycosyltransferase family 2 protein [Anaerolineae bacterium]
MNSILVSVIIPSHNAAHWICETLDSILAQPHPETYEVIVIDDGSVDDTGPLIQEQYKDRVRYYFQQHRGRAAARNAGVKIAHGDFIHFFDADDIMEPNALDARLECLQEHTEFAAAYSRPWMFWDDAKDDLLEYDRSPYFVSGDILKAEIQTPFLLPIMVLLRREWAEKVGGMDEQLRSNEDWHFWLKIAAAGGRFAYVEGPPVARYRLRRQNSIESGVIHELSGIQTLEKLKPLLRNRPDYRSLELDKVQARWQAGYGQYLLLQGNRRQGIVQLTRSFVHNREHLLSRIMLIVFAALFPPNAFEMRLDQFKRLLKRVARQS